MDKENNFDIISTAPYKNIFISFFQWCYFFDDVSSIITTWNQISGWAVLSISTAIHPQRIRFNMSNSGLQSSLVEFFSQFVLSLGCSLVKPNEFINKYSSLLRAYQNWNTICSPLNGITNTKWFAWFVLFYFKYNHITTCLAFYHRAYLTSCAGYFLSTGHKLETPEEETSIEDCVH